jgi:hypothetical protein
MSFGQTCQVKSSQCIIRENHGVSSEYLSFFFRPAIILSIQLELLFLQPKRTFMQLFCKGLREFFKVNSDRITFNQSLAKRHLCRYKPIIFSLKLIWIDWTAPKIGHDFRKLRFSKMKIIKKCG